MSTGRQDLQSVGPEIGAHTGTGKIPSKSTTTATSPAAAAGQPMVRIGVWAAGGPPRLLAGGSGLQIYSVVGNHVPATSRGTGNRDWRIRALQTRAEPSSQSEAADAKGQPEPGLIDALPVGRFLYSSMTGPGFFRTMSRSLSPFINRALSGVAHSNYITNS